jgi:hypothetical protein
MDDLSLIINDLPPGTELTKQNVENMHRLFPVPSDFEILWASVEAFGGHPSGIVITNRALIIKGTSDGVKAINEEQEKNKEEQKNNKVTVLYQIILWEHFDPNDFEVEDGPDEFYTIKYSSMKFPNFSSDCYAKDFFSYAKKHKEKRKKTLDAAIDAAASLNVMGLDNVVFAAAYGEDAGNVGHGIYAEEAGAILDRFNGERVEVVGRDNAKNGPDKIVDSNPVQCKYCKSANASVNNCFKKNGAGVKEFRYYDMSGNPMMVEVPKDQYDKAIELMKKNITEGKVPGVNNPDAAYTIIRKGKLTYAQARNLAKAGTIESITYDIATGAVSCSFAFGLSSLVSFAFTFIKTKDAKEAARDAALTGLQTFGLSLASQVLSTQIARTSLQNNLIPIADLIMKNLGSKTTQNLINAIRKLAGKKPIYGAAAQKSLAKALRANVITQGISFVVLSFPDTLKTIRKEMSGHQYAKNVTTLFASFVGAGAAGLGATVLVGMKIAQKIPNPVAKGIVFVVSLAGGQFAAKGVRKAFEVFREDDDVISRRMFDSILMSVCLDFMFGDEEIKRFLAELFKDKENKKAMKTVMERLYSSDEQYTMLRAVMDRAAIKIVKERPVLLQEQEPDCDSLSDALAEVIADSELEEASA